MGRVLSFIALEVRRLASIGIVLAVPLGCNEDLPPVRWTGQSLVYHADADADACAGAFVLQDTYVRRLSEMLEVEIDRPVSFSLLSDEELEGVCENETILGCEFDGDAYSARAVHFHELAHAVARRGDIHGSVAFREGFAEALSNGFEPKKLRVPVEPVLREFGYLDEDYYTAGLFVRFLMDRHGLPNVSEFLKGTSKEQSFDAVSGVFADVFGEPLAAAINAFDAYPSCSAWSNRLALVECGLEVTPWVGNSWEAEVAVDCSDEDVLGPLVDGKSLVWATRALSIDAPGQFIARTMTTSEGDATVRLTRCGSCWDAFDVTILPDQEKPLDLPQGRYYITFIREFDKPGGLRFSLDRRVP